MKLQRPYIAMAMALVACHSAFAQTPETPAPATTTQATGQLSEADRYAMMKLAQGDIAEIAMSQLAAEKSPNVAVRATSRVMVRDHTNSLQQLRQLATTHNVQLPTETDPIHQALLQRLQTLSGADFERLYVATQIQHHAMTLTDLHHVQMVGQLAPLTQMASALEPAVAEHLIMWRRVGRGMGITSTLGLPNSEEVQMRNRRH